jgi:hypothetical protein
MANLSRKDLEVRYQMFDKFSLVDQRAYYHRTIEKHDMASGQVNRIRALISLLTGASAAVAGLFVGIFFTTSGSCVLGTTDPNFCTGLNIVVDIAILLSVALPALGGFFGTLADLYQWDRQISIYKAAADSIEVADAHSPYDEMDDLTYRASLIAYSQGTLQVMSDETAQWGQSIRTPKGLQAYVEEAREKAAKIGGNADAGAVPDAEPPIMTTALPDKPVAPDKSVTPPTDTATGSGEENSAG